MAKPTELTLSEKSYSSIKLNYYRQTQVNVYCPRCFSYRGRPSEDSLNRNQDLSKKFSQKESMKQGKRQRSGKDLEVEEAIYKWFKSVLDSGVRISGMVLRVKAFAEFAVKLGKSDFVATEGWLSRWKTRHQIKSRLTHGEKSSANFEGAEIWVSTVLPQILEEYNPENIYNADETGLYFRATPDRSLCYAYEQLSGSKKAMDRVTILVYANMLGNDKLKLLMIGKSKQPRCSKILTWKLYLSHIGLTRIPG